MISTEEQTGSLKEKVIGYMA